MKYLRFFTMLLLCSVAAISHSAAITNGDFASCDYTGWNKLIDFDPDTGTSSDFEITSGDCAAKMNVDSQDTLAYLGNELSQTLDLSNSSSSPLQLSFDITVDSEFNSNDTFFVADYFVIALYDSVTELFYDETGGLGSLFEGDIDGAASYSKSFFLDASSFDSGDWSLVFQLNLGADDNEVTDFGASSMTIDNVTLNAVNTPSMLLLVLASMTLVFRRSLTFKSFTKFSLKNTTQL